MRVQHTQEKRAKALVMTYARGNGISSASLMDRLVDHDIKPYMLDIARAALRDEGKPILSTKQGKDSWTVLATSDRDQEDMINQLLNDHYVQTCRKARALASMDDQTVRKMLIKHATQTGLMLGKTRAEIKQDVAPIRT